MVIVPYAVSSIHAIEELLLLLDMPRTYLGMATIF
jgi:hypothetical protein